MKTLVADLNARISASTRYHANTVAEYFSTASLDWWNPTQACYNKQKQAISNWIKELNPHKVLELGAGFGRISELLDKLPKATITFVDINKKAISTLRGKFPHRTVIESDIKSFKLEKEKYDLIAAVEILVHIPDIKNLIKRIHGALQDEGTFITSITPVSWYEKNWPRKPTIHRGIDENEFEDYISKYFEIKERVESDNGQLVTYILSKKCLSK